MFKGLTGVMTVNPLDLTSNTWGGGSQRLLGKDTMKQQRAIKAAEMLYTPALRQKGSLEGR